MQSNAAQPAGRQLAAASRAGIEVGWAANADEVREVQRLRFEVFVHELGARLATTVAGYDIDRFDDFCEHLLVRDIATRKVIGTYRLLTPGQAQRAGGTYSDTEFDLAALDGLRPRMVELGRTCVHPEYRHGAVLLALWGALAQFMIRNALDTMIGCASLPLRAVGAGDDGLRAAAGIWNRVRRNSLAAPRYRVSPRVPLPLDLVPGGEAEPPALIKGYLRLGARVLGPPAWDSQFRTADLPMLMHVADLPLRYRQSPARG